MNIPYVNEDMEGVRQVALQHLQEQTKEIFDEIRKKVTHMKPCCELTLNAIEKKYSK